MKTIVVLFALASVIVGCGNKKTADVVASATDSIALPAEFNYKGKFVMGSMKNVQTVMTCNKQLSELNGAIGEFLADSVTLHFADGSTVEGTRDSIVAVMTSYIGSLTSLHLEFVTSIPLDNLTTGDQWVIQWTDEIHKHKDGKVDDLNVHEDYRLVDGKIREVYQYIHQANAAAPPAK